MILNSNKDYDFQINVTLNCKDCGDTNLTFDTYKDYEKNDFPIFLEDEAIVYTTSEDNKKIVLGVMCQKCGSDYSLNLKIN